MPSRETYQVTYACDCEGQKVTGIQEREVFTLQSQKSTKMLDGWSIEWVTDGKKICFWMKKIALVIGIALPILKLRT